MRAPSLGEMEPGYRRSKLKFESPARGRAAPRSGAAREGGLCANSPAASSRSGTRHRRVRKTSSFGTPFRTRIADPEKEAADAPHRASHLDPLRGGPLHRPASRLLEPTAEGGARHPQDAGHVLEPTPLVEQRESRAKVHVLARASAVLPRRLGAADAGEDALTDQGRFVVRERPQQLQ